jgi:hypothetical protein
MADTHGDDLGAISAPGTITVVDPDSAAPGAQPVPVRANGRKRKRAEQAPADRVVEGEVTEEDGIPTQHISQEQWNTKDDPPAEQEHTSSSYVQRLLDAKHRRRRTGKHVEQAQLKEDLEDVKKFLAMSDEDKEAYLLIYEYDDTRRSTVDGLAKASSLALRVGLAYTIPSRDYDIAAVALDQPEVKDSITNLWDIVNLDGYEQTAAVKGLSALGHIGDVILTAFMKIYQNITRAGEMRDKKEEQARQRGAGVQSMFDVTASNHNGGNIPTGTPTGEVIGTI